MKYSPLDKLNFLINSYGRLFAALFKIRVWFPFLILALFQAAGLLALMYYYAPGLNHVVYPLLSSIFPAGIFHYPQYYLALPGIYSGYDTFILGPIVWVILSAAAVYILGGYYRGEKKSFGEALRKASRSYPSLLVFWIIETAIMFAVLVLLNSGFKSMVIASPRLKFVFEFAYQLISFVFSAFLVYTVPVIILSGRGIGGAIVESLKICGRNLFLTYFIVAIPGAVGAILDLFISNFSPQIIMLFNPGLVPAMLFVRICLGIFLNLFLFGAAVFIYNKMARQK